MQQLVKLVGIARLAAEGTLLREKQRVEYRSLPTRRWLNRCHSNRVPFDWTINPYRGCEYGCRYCYARFTHEFMERPDPAAFEREIYAKDWDADKFRLELRGIKAGQVIGLGTATDPYQPAERIFLRTREVLKAMIGIRGVSIFVTTKSDLTARDVALFRELGRDNAVRVTTSVTTTDTGLARLLEPMAPRPDLRLQAVAALSAAGVRTGVIASPVLPWITDSRDTLDRVARCAKESGADQFGANVLFLKPAAQKVFFPFLEQAFPSYAAEYRGSYSQSAYIEAGYAAGLQKMVKEIRDRLLLGSRDLERARPPAPTGAQMLLF